MTFRDSDDRIVPMKLEAQSSGSKSGMAQRHLSRRSQKSYVNWSDFNRFTTLHPLASPNRLTDLIAMKQQIKSSANLIK